MIKQNAVGSLRKQVEKETHLDHVHGHTVDSSRNNAVSGTHESHTPCVVADASSATHRKDRRITVKESVSAHPNWLESCPPHFRFPIFMRLQLFKLRQILLVTFVSFHFFDSHGC